MGSVIPDFEDVPDAPPEYLEKQSEENMVKAIELLVPMLYFASNVVALPVGIRGLMRSSMHCLQQARRNVLNREK